MYHHKDYQRFSMLLNKVLSFALDLTKVRTNDSRNGIKHLVIGGRIVVATGGIIRDGDQEHRFSEIWSLGDEEQSRDRHMQLLEFFTGRRPRHTNNINNTEGSTEQIEDENVLNEMNERARNYTENDMETLKWFVAVMHDEIKRKNFYAKCFNTAKEQIEQNPSAVRGDALYYQQATGRDRRTSSLPTVPEVALGYNQTSVDEKMMFVVSVKGGGLKCINITHPHFLPLKFPLLFLYGEDGWCTNIKLADGSDDLRSTRVSLNEFLRFITQYRCNSTSTNIEEYLASNNMIWNSINLGGSVVEEFYATISLMVEQNKLAYHNMHQNTTRWVNPNTNLDTNESLDRQSTPSNSLPSSFYGSPKFLKMLYQKTVALFAAMGAPNLFLTVTMNPKHAEKLLETLPGNHNTTYPRNNLISRGFQQIVSEIDRDIEKILGMKVTAKSWITEFQKRGLPHIHMAIRCPELEREDENGEAVIDYEKLDLIVKMFT